MLIGPVAVIFCGRLGKIELDAVSLAVSVIKYIFLLFFLGHTTIVFIYISNEKYA